MIKSNDKERADVLLVRRGIFQTREKAKAAIMEGIVSFNDIVINKAGTLVSCKSRIDLKEQPRYVSRGGIKLEKAVAVFNIDLTNKVAIDVGASTGGFTDCLLDQGARRVIAVDVGYGQLAWTLRNDPRVQVLERTNIRYLKPADIVELADIATVDVSFISILKIVDSLLSLLRPIAEILILVKPQFEAGRELVEKKGVIRNPEVHENVLSGIVNGLIRKKLIPLGLAFSPILGPKGNIEFLLYLRKGSDCKNCVTSELINSTVTKAHESLRRI